jgi:hypothetical protein
VRAGRAVYRVEIGGEAIDMLCRYGWLDELDACDPAAVGRAIGRSGDSSRRRRNKALSW